MFEVIALQLEKSLHEHNRETIDNLMQNGYFHLPRVDVINYSRLLCFLQLADCANIFAMFLDQNNSKNRL